MKSIMVMFFCLILFNCTTVELVENWKNPEIESYIPNKVFLIGLTSNHDARQQFETQLQEELSYRGIKSVKSLDFLDFSFTSEKKTEEELKNLDNKLINDGFDTILFTKVIGVEDKLVYKKNYDDYDSTYRKFQEDYLRYQDAFYNPGYYEEYTVYHTETSMYCICPTKDRELIWKGYIDINDPKLINESVKEYVRLIVVVLEAQKLINSIEAEQIMDEQAIN